MLPPTHTGIPEDSHEEPSKSRLAAVVESSHEAIISKSLEGVITSWNPAAEKIFGYTAEEAIGQPMFMLLRSDQADEEKGILSRMARGEKIEDFETIRVAKSGKHTRVSLTLTPTRNSQGTVTGVSISAQDLTARQLLEEKLRHAQKAEAIGLLAAGVAHDFTNLLMIIGSNIELLLLSEQNLRPESKDFIQEIMNATGQAATLSRQLLAFTQLEATKTQVLDLNLLTSNFLKLLRRILGENIQVKSEFSPTALLVNADPGLIEHVLMNLVVNARESMPQGGTLTIRTNLEVMAPTGLSRDFGGRDGSFACLTVRDTGGGIAPDNLSPTFEPFFTDKGAGMGLATAYRIVKEHNGWIELESQLQAGSTYRVYLPLAPPAAGPHNGATGKKAHRGTETILLVEDEKSLRELMVLVLKDHGYTVLEAASGAAAQKVWAEHGSDIDLLLTDMVTPGGVTGLELAKRLRKQVPDLKVILTSGYSSHLTGIDPASAQNLALLKKPFSSLTLAEAVRDCLHGS